MRFAHEGLDWMTHGLENIHRSSRGTHITQTPLKVPGLSSSVAKGPSARTRNHGIIEEPSMMKQVSGHPLGEKKSKRKGS